MDSSTEQLDQENASHEQDIYGQLNLDPNSDLYHGDDYYYLPSNSNFFLHYTIQFPYTNHARHILAGPVIFYSCVPAIVLGVVFLVVLAQKSMRSLNSLLLGNICLTHLLTAIAILPPAIFYHFSKYRQDFVPFRWCQAIMYSAYIRITLQAPSVWLMLLLGIVRYIAICHPLKVKIWCSGVRLKWTVVIVWVTFMSTNSIDAFIYVVKPIQVESQDGGEEYATCYRETRTWFHKFHDVYISGFVLYRLIVINVLPWSMLVVITGMLVHQLKKTVKLRNQMAEHVSRHTQGHQESQKTSLLLVIILIVFIISETPVCVYTFIVILGRLTWIQILSDESSKIMIVASDELFLVQIVARFIVHFVMSVNFRKCLKNLSFRKC